MRLHEPLQGASLRVALADDHVIVRSALRQFLSGEPDIQIVGECGSGRGVIDLVRKTAVDVLLLDIGMPDQSGLDCMTMIRAKSPETAILVLSGHSMEQYAVTTLRLGAMGYLNKQCEPTEILEAIRTLATGKRYIQPDLMDLLARHTDSSSGTPPHHALTEREFQIMIKLAKGASSGAIGEELSLSSRTVSTYRTQLLKKLDVHNNSGLTHYAITHRLID